ncbi:hypothetical protein SAMN05444354_110256 [Stigmatella aurantiaca]|uniref:Uncharacterized protein n=1 Tax=Stigmatella aurantiaca TaxID=41 RepID=A0A1H7UYU3_STIAU|nr:MULTISPECIES: hypothetical protein [Stigmatella]SEM02044.1 hypothetical protein SAMN05444354_110256 [Stigmatella aurantiaca]
MPVLRHAFILQAVQELGRFTSVLSRAREGTSLEAGLRSIREACVATLGMEFDTLTRFDAASVVGLFSHPEQARILARLVDEQARLFVSHGQLQAALGDSLYADQLLACSRQRFGVPRDARAAETLQLEAGEPSPLV